MWWGREKGGALSRGEDDILRVEDTIKIQVDDGLTCSGWRIHECQVILPPKALANAAESSLPY
jgi:hypothetical protein